MSCRYTYRYNMKIDLLNRLLKTGSFYMDDIKLKSCHDRHRIFNDTLLLKIQIVLICLRYNVACLKTFNTSVKFLKNIHILKFCFQVHLSILLSKGRKILLLAQRNMCHQRFSIMNQQILGL